MNNPANNRCTIGCDGTQDGLGPDRVELATLIGRSPIIGFEQKSDGRWWIRLERRLSGSTPRERTTTTGRARDSSRASSSADNSATARAEAAAEERVLDALVGDNASPATRASFLEKLRRGDLDEREIELDLREQGGAPAIDLPGMAGSQIGVLNLSDLLGKAFGGPVKRRKVRVKNAYEPLIAEESDKLLDQEAMTREAIDLAENDGIVFLDEIDKIARGGDAARGGADVSREGVQRDLLPLIEGATVATKYGPVKTDHVLFIASGAFHLTKPSDLLPELQGRLPIRVELDALTREDFRRILVDTEASLLKQYAALMATEGVDLVFEPSAVEAIADAAALVNSTVENIGARRLATIMETVLDEVSFGAGERGGETVIVDAAFVEARLGAIARDADLSKYIL